MARKISSILFIIYLIIVFNFSPSITFGQTITPTPTPDNSASLQSLENQIQDLERKISDLQGQEKTLKSQIGVFDSQIKITQLRINATQQKIMVLTLDISTAKKKI